MRFAMLWGTMVLVTCSAALAAEEFSGHQAIRDAQALYNSGQYFKAARYAFSAKEADAGLAAESYSWTARGLMRARLYHSA
ncbi:MAG: hypothetical protein NDJ90_11290, partial [Oligoflexia bacterium]|nr:hypothetical protein [Oligoflexia bacterium]